MTKDISHEPAECPYCKSQTVQVKITTTLSFQKICPVYKDGIAGVNTDEVGDSFGEMFGEPLNYPTRGLAFTCLSCKRFWLPCDYQWVKGDNGIYSFVKNEKKTHKKGKKHENNVQN